MVASIRTTLSEGYEFADVVVGLFNPKNVFLPRSFYQCILHSSKLQSRNSLFAPLSCSPTISVKLKNANLIPPPNHRVNLSQIKGSFRRFRNGFIRKIAVNVIDREQNFFDAMIAARVESLDVGRRATALDSWKRVVKILYNDSKAQFSAFRTPWNWNEMARGQKCMKCWLLHRFCELPPVRGPVVSYWVKAFKVCNCSEPLAVAIKILELRTCITWMRLDFVLDLFKIHMSL